MFDMNIKEVTVQSNTEFIWHRKRAKLINLAVTRPDCVKVRGASPGELVVKVGRTVLTLRRPELRRY